MSNRGEGMHFVYHNTYGKYEDLSYYDSHSIEGIANRRNEAIAQLEAMGEFLFCKSLKRIVIKKKSENIDLGETEIFYKVMLYPRSEATTIMNHSENIKIFSKDNSMYFSVHEVYPIIYICDSDHERIEFINDANGFRF